MKISARNILSGTVRTITPGGINSVVTIEIAGGAQVVSVITNDSVARLALAVGKPAHAVIKASDVMVAID